MSKHLQPKESKLTNNEKKQIRRYIVRKAIKTISGMAMIAGFVLVFLASGAKELSYIIKLGVSGCLVLWLGVMIYTLMDKHERILRLRALERKRLKAKVYINSVEDRRQ